MNVRKALIPMLVIVAAALAPTALAEWPDDRAGARGPGAIAEQQSVPVRPDDRAGARGPGVLGSQQLSSPTRPDDRDGVRGRGAFTPSVAQPTSTGFDWGDALIGSLGGIGTALMLTGLLFLVMSRRSKARLA